MSAIYLTDLSHADLLLYVVEAEKRAAEEAVEAEKRAYAASVEAAEEAGEDINGWIDYLREEAEEAEEKLLSEIECWKLIAGHVVVKDHSGN